jgi:hypothetical protein
MMRSCIRLAKIGHSPLPPSQPSHACASSVVLQITLSTMTSFNVRVYLVVKIQCSTKPSSFLSSNNLEHKHNFTTTCCQWDNVVVASPCSALITALPSNLMEHRESTHPLCRPNSSKPKQMLSCPTRRELC